MGTPTMSPPGWYTDPTGRHESRYWDSAHWTARVADHGVPTVEAPLPVVPDYPPQELRPPLPATAAPAKVGFRAVLAVPWRVTLLQVALFAFGAALAFVMFAEATLSTVVNDYNDTGRLPAESTMRWTAWVYHYTSTSISYARSPWLLWVVMGVGLIFATNLMVSKSQALANAMPMGGGRTRRVWARRALAEKTRLREALHGAGAAQTLVRLRGRMACLVGTGVAALGTAGMAMYAILAREPMFGRGAGAYTGDLSIGVGPVVCLVAALLVLAALAAAWPMRGERHVWVMPDGTLRAA